MSKRKSNKTSSMDTATQRGLNIRSKGQGEERRRGTSSSLDSQSSPKESGKIQLIRHSSESNLAQHYGLSRSAQYGLLAVAVLLTVHSGYEIWRLMEIGSERLTDWQKVVLVWSSGWITAASTGLGAIPFVFVGEPNVHAVAYSNAVAAGMMLAASIGLIAEGFFEETTPDTVFWPILRVLIGLYLGVAFVKGTSYLLGDNDTSNLLDVQVLNMRRVLIIMAVMTLHSFSEGVGIGVSYHSQALGGFISATMAVHNIPEGVAISIVLLPRGFSLLSTTLWCIFSSLPQPLMAIPAYLSVTTFQFIAPIGFGFAAGAMSYVAIFELLEEAEEYISQIKAWTVLIISMILMGITQVLIRESSF